MAKAQQIQVTLIGAGTIGLSFAALHLAHALTTNLEVTLVVHDIRPGIEEYILNTLPTYLVGALAAQKRPKLGASLRDLVSHCLSDGVIKIDNDIESAVSKADCVQEQGPENAAFKVDLWPKVEGACPPHALLWSSTSGIPASTQSSKMKDPTRLIVVHPYNPPHIMPLLEVVPSPATSSDVIDRTMKFWDSMGRAPVLLKKEVTGFVANRLALALFREAVHLVNEGVTSVADLDTIVQNSMGPRWAVAGPFHSYHTGGGQEGLEGLFKNIGGTIQACWDDSGKVKVGDGWEKEIFSETTGAYGVVDITATKDRDSKTLQVLDAVHSQHSPKS